MSNYLSIIGACVFPNIGGWAGAFVSRNNIDKWYEKLVLPSWRPPNWAFGPVWTGLYTSMGYASYLVYRDGGGFDGAARLPLALFGTQLAFNWAWTPIFFGCHKLGWALADLVAIDVFAAACAYAFSQTNKTAGLIMIPYLAWLSLATALNYSIWKNNPKKEN